MPSRWDILPMHLGIIGLIGAIAVTGLSTWKVFVFPSDSPDVTEELWEGLWITCHKYSELQVDCKPYDLDRDLTPELKASRWLMCFSIGVIVVALIITGSLFHETFSFCDTEKNKNVILAVGGILFWVSVLTLLIPVSWGRHSINGSDNGVDSQKWERGSAIYIGWASSAFLFLAGAILLIRWSNSVLLQSHSLDQRKGR